MTAQYQLNAKAILDKQFNVDLKGYAPREVDEFLDKVIADYQTYDETIRELERACGTMRTRWSS